jgi:hypothetical protein
MGICWPPSQPVSPSPVPSTHRTYRDSPVPSPPLLATVTASHPLSRFCWAGPSRPSVTDPRLRSHTQSLSLTVKSLSLVRSLPGSSGIYRALAAWFLNPTIRAESRFSNPTVRAGSAGRLKRGTVVSRTDALREFIYKILEDLQGEIFEFP